MLWQARRAVNVIDMYYVPFTARSLKKGRSRLVERLVPLLCIRTAGTAVIKLYIVACINGYVREPNFRRWLLQMP